MEPARPVDDSAAATAAAKLPAQLAAHLGRGGKLESYHGQGVREAVQSAEWGRVGPRWDDPRYLHLSGKELDTEMKKGSKLGVLFAKALDLVKRTVEKVKGTVVHGYYVRLQFAKLHLSMHQDKPSECPFFTCRLNLLPFFISVSNSLTQCRLNLHRPIPSQVVTSSAYACASR